MNKTSNNLEATTDPAPWDLGLVLTIDKTVLTYKPSSCMMVGVRATILITCPSFPNYA